VLDVIDVYGHVIALAVSVRWQQTQHHTVTLVCYVVIRVARYVALPCVVRVCVGIVGKLDYVLDVLVLFIVLAEHYLIVVGIPLLTARLEIHRLV